MWGDYTHHTVEPWIFMLLEVPEHYAIFKDKNKDVLISVG